MLFVSMISLGFDEFVTDEASLTTLCKVSLTLIITELASSATTSPILADNFEAFTVLASSAFIFKLLH